MTQHRGAMPHPAVLQLGVSIFGSATGGVRWLFGMSAAADLAWAVTTGVAPLPAGVDVIRDLIHRRADTAGLRATADILGLVSPREAHAARREHAEVAHLAGMLVHMVDDLPEDGPDDEEVIAMRRVLYSLHAILTLHRASEEERLMGVVDTPDDEVLGAAS
jgi:hypothetical protein